jgi:hypothetical protein
MPGEKAVRLAENGLKTALKQMDVTRLDRENLGLAVFQWRNARVPIIGDIPGMIPAALLDPLALFVDLSA